MKRGSTHSEDSKKHLSEILKGIKHSEERRQNISNSLKGIVLSEKHKTAITNSLIGKKRLPFSEEWRIHISEGQKGRECSDETRRKLSLVHKGKPKSEETKIKFRNRTNSIEYRMFMSEQTKKLWKTEEFRTKIAEGRIYALSNSRITSPEFIVGSLLNDFPNDFEYVGDGTKWIVGKNPDFLDKHNKKIIEVFGNYWHSEKIIGKSKCKHEKETIDHYKKYGYDTLIIWEKELECTETVKAKIGEFYGV